MSSHTRQQLESYLKTVSVKADKVLDIGGAQKPIKGRTKTWEVGEYKILDLEQPHEGKAPDLVYDIQKKPDFNFNPYYDLIFCLEVSEYWHNPYQAMQNIANLCKTGGDLVISFPFVYPVHRPSGEDCLRYTEHGARKLLGSAGFKVESVYYRMEKFREELSWFFSSNGMKPDQDYPHHDVVGFVFRASKITS